MIILMILTNVIRSFWVLDSLIAQERSGAITIWFFHGITWRWWVTRMGRWALTAAFDINLLWVAHYDSIININQKLFIQFRYVYINGMDGQWKGVSSRFLFVIESETMRSIKELRYRHSPTNCRPQVAVGWAHCEED
jgi:hypothetical protein